MSSVVIFPKRTKHCATDECMWAGDSDCDVCSTDFCAECREQHVCPNQAFAGGPEREDYDAR